MTDPRDDIRRARGGDREAIERLLARCSEVMQRHAQARIGPALRAKIRVSDLLQSTNLDVIRSVGRFEGETYEQFVAWVVRGLDNNIRDKVKFYGRDRRRGEELTPHDDPPPGDGPGPATTAMNRDEEALVRRALERLAPDHRRIIELVLLQGSSHQEAAPLMGRTETATRALLVRARAALLVEVAHLRGHGG